MKLQEVYKAQILKRAESLGWSYLEKLIGYGEYERARKILSERLTDAPDVGEDNYRLFLISVLDGRTSDGLKYLEEAAKDQRYWGISRSPYKILYCSQSKSIIPPDEAFLLSGEFSRDLDGELYWKSASYAKCFTSITYPSKDVQAELKAHLQKETLVINDSIMEYYRLEGINKESFIRKQKDKKQEETSLKLEALRQETEDAREKKREKNRSTTLASSKKSPEKKTEVAGGLKIIFAILKIARFFFAYLLPILYLFTAFVNAMKDENCEGIHKVFIALPLFVWLVTIVYVRFKVLKRFEQQRKRVTGAWWLFYLPTTFMLIYRTFLARQESLASAGACLATALLTCVLLVPQLIFMLPFGKSPRTREDFYSAALCGVICFIIFPILCVTLTDVTLDTIGQGINAAIQTHK